MLAPLPDATKSSLFLEVLPIPTAFEKCPLPGPSPTSGRGMELTQTQSALTIASHAAPV